MNEWPEYPECSMCDELARRRFGAQAAADFSAMADVRVLTTRHWSDDACPRQAQFPAPVLWSA
ncbi:hypothetical protein GCM10020229_02450 [Kitasatospora albolonga]